MNTTDKNITYRIAQLSDVDTVYDFAIKQNFTDSDDEVENMIAVWSSAFRKESLEHYFKLGWSFLALDENQQVAGFFLGQPLLFFDHQTQSLWIEYVCAVNSTITTELVDIAYRLSREKHFQRVLISENIQKLNMQKEFPFQKWERNSFVLKTTK